MIQRKQTLFILAAVTIGIISLSMPLGKLIPQGMGTPYTLFNLWMKTSDGIFDFRVCALFAIQITTCIIGMFSIFNYRNRKVQARMCLANILLLLLWYAALGVTVYSLSDSLTFRPMFYICFPFVSMVLYFTGRRGIIADEKLVRAADRIR